MLLILTGDAALATAQLVVTMTPQRIEEAIELAADERAAERFLDAYVIQSRTGWGNGPRIGVFTTPYARVVRAALLARKNARPFTASDLNCELLAPELHVIAVKEAPATDNTAAAVIAAVLVRRRDVKTSVVEIQRLSFAPLTKEYEERYGKTIERPATVTVFPLSALDGANEMLTIFDRTARGSSAMSGCMECAVPFDPTRIR
jgi:hypothetical protein